MTTDDHRPLALITGASSGIGYALADDLGHRGYDLVIAAEDDEIHEAARRLGGHGAVIPIQVDLATAAGVETLHTRVTELNRPLDVVAINAGVGVGGDFARDNALDAELRLIDLNVRSSVHLAKLVLARMVAQRAGRVLITSSIAATTPGPYQATYGASKAFLLSFSEAIRHELRDSGVTVTALMPGPTDTEFFARAGIEDTKLGQSKKDDPAEVARVGLDALFDGKDHVVTGARNKAQTLASKVLPETAKAAAHGKLSEPGSGN